MNDRETVERMIAKLSEMESEELAELSLAIDAELERRSAKMDGDWLLVEPDGTKTPLPLGETRDA